MDKVYIAIVLNAQRLMLDAKLLAAHGSFQSAVSLAILSLEESGKACIVRWKRSGLITRDISKDRAGLKNLNRTISGVSA